MTDAHDQLAGTDGGAVPDPAGRVPDPVGHVTDRVTPRPLRLRARVPAVTGDRIPQAERSFFVEEFRGITIVISLAATAVDPGPVIAGIDAGFSDGDTRLVVVVPDDATAGRLAAAAGRPLPVLEAGATPDERWLAELWVTATDHRTVIVSAAGASTDAVAGHVAAGLRAAKVVFTDPVGGWGDPPRSFADLDAVASAFAADLAHRGRGDLAAAMDRALSGGAFSANLCRAADLDAELFTFDGAGTLFTRGGYVRVTDLRVDDLPAVEALIGQGVDDGVLRPRSRRQIAELAVRGLGARVIRTGHLAGVVGLEVEPYRADRVGEISGLVTVSQFSGFGAGGLLVDGLVQRARIMGLDALFAVTVSDRAAVFFTRCGFVERDPDAAPATKWAGYSPSRRARARLFWRDVSSAHGR